MKEQINSLWFEVRPEEQYLTPMHNSFLTIAYHIGFLPMLMIFIPLIPVFVYPFKRKNPTKEKDFLTLAVIAAIGWSSFHVVLELPHSSAFIWLIYFTTVYQFQVSKSIN